MELAKQIEIAPKNGDFIVLQDTCSWEVGRWAQDANSWVQPDGTPVRISPTHWTPVYGDIDVADTTDRERLPFLASSFSDDETAPTQKRPLTRLILALAAAVFCVGGLGFWIGSKDSSSDNSAAELERVFSQERDRAYANIGGLTAARELQTVALAEAMESKRIAEAKQRDLKRADESEAKAEALARELASARENDAAARNLAAARERESAAQALEAKRTADARQKELKQSLDESEKRADALARELVSARENDVAARNLAAARERENAAQALETKRAADARQRELKQLLDESEKRADALARELMSVRETIALAGKLSNAEVIAHDAASSTGPLNRPIEGSNAASETTGSVTSPQSRDGVPAGEQAASDTAPGDATAGASGQLAPLDRSPHGSPQPPNAMSSADEAKLVARAESLIKQSDFAGARLLLEHAFEKGSARAAFLMAETYDRKILRSMRAYGVRADAQLARQFYELAATAGIEKARERIEALQSDAAIDARTGGEKRTREESRAEAASKSRTAR
jgi:hypothetical protein